MFSDNCESICLFEDYIVYMLSGSRQIDYSMASRTMAFDINGLQWNEEILEYAGIDKKLFSKTVPTGSRAENIRKELAIIIYNFSSYDIRSSLTCGQ